MPLNLEEILALPDIGQKINYLKKGRKTELPDRCKLWDDWNPERHEIMVDKKKYPDRKVLEKEAEKLQQEVDRVEKKLSNEKFVAKAPAAVVEAERAKGADYQAQREAVLERIATLKKI